MRDAGYRAIDSLSAEKGYRHWHADLSNRDTPQEAGIGFTVLPKLKGKREVRERVGGVGGESDLMYAYILTPPLYPMHGAWLFTVALTAGKDFLGRDALEAQRTSGLKRKLVCLTLDSGSHLEGAAPLHGQETIWRDGEWIGYVRSSAYGHTVQTSVAYVGTHV